MKTCTICDKPLPFGRSKYCSKACYFASKRLFNQRRYHADPASAEAAIAKSRAWALANREQRNEARRALYARKKAEKFARVLSKAKP